MGMDMNMDMDMDMDTDTRMSSPTKKRSLPNDLSISTTKPRRSRRRLSICSSHTSKSSSLFDRLTDDLLIEILLRVPVKPLHRSKCVSKNWLSLISSTCFARSYMLTHHHNNMLLFEAQRSEPYHGQIYALPLLHGAYHQLSSIPLTFDFVLPLCRDFYDINDYGNEANNWEVTTKVLQHVFLVGTYGGLVLLSASFQDYHPEKSQYFYYQYYLCNPVSKQWVQLPLISAFDSVGFTCYHAQQACGQGGVSRVWADTTSYENVIRNNADYDPNKIDFTIVSINRDEEKDEFIASVFSSTDEAAEWSIFHVPCPPGSRWILGGTKLVFLNGKFHWCGINCIAAYDPFNKPLHCDTIPLPPMDPLESENGRILLLEACQGNLRLVRVFSRKRFMVWDLVDYANKVWVQKHDVHIDTDLIFQSFVGVAAMDKVYVRADCSTVKLYDVRNKSIQHVYDPINLDKVKAEGGQRVKSQKTGIYKQWKASTHNKVSSRGTDNEGNGEKSLLPKEIPRWQQQRQIPNAHLPSEIKDLEQVRKQRQQKATQQCNVKNNPKKGKGNKFGKNGMKRMSK